MGLTFNYELRLPSSFTGDHVSVVLQRLKSRAKRLQFVAISETYEGVDDAPADIWRHAFNVFAGVNASQVDPDERKFSGDLSTARGFLAHPGKGSEPASFGFLLREFHDDSSHEWFWQGMCKTQYASILGEKHFIDCHLRLVDMMEYAIQLGIDVTVWDEGHYWETRDHNRLLTEVDKMNRLVARVAGRFHDAIGGVAPVHSPIFEHPEFERLEG